jgi:hypothetical protein
MGTHMFKFFLELIFLATKEPPVYLNLFLTFASLLYTTFLTR